MAGGKIIRITGGTSTIECESYNVFCENFYMSAGGKSSFTADGGIYFGEPQEPTTGGKYIIKGYWTDEKDNRITEALLGETVKFHVETQDIPDGKTIRMILFDDDIHKSESDSNNGNDQVPLYPVYKGKKPTEYNESQETAVQNNKAVKTIVLGEYFSWLAAQEEDKMVELFFTCSYEDQKEDLPIQFHDYLQVKGLPKIIFVNGQWRLAKYSFGEMVGPTKPKKPYWYDGDEMINSAKIYFKITDNYKIKNQELTNENLENENFILYYDGSSYAGGDQSGSDRFANERQFAQENFEEITNGLGGNEVYLISHSEGGAYAAGMADYLYEKGIKIGEHILLSTDEANEFSINPEIPSYQLTYMYFASKNDISPYLLTPEVGSLKLSYKSWGGYYAVIDWVVGEHIVRGVKKAGIVRKNDLDWQGLHGNTNDISIFNEIGDLKNVTYHEAVGVGNDGEPYSGIGQSATPYHTIFYKIDDQYISLNCPPISKISK